MKSVYLEIGSTCYCRCAACNMSNVPYNTPSIGHITDRLVKLSLNNVLEVRLTGKDPLTNDKIKNILSIINAFDMKSHLATTGLHRDFSKNEALLLVNKLKISMHGVYNMHSNLMFTYNWQYLIINLNYLISKNKLPELYYTFINHPTIFNYSLNSAKNLIEFIKSFKSIPFYKLSFFPQHDDSWVHYHEYEIFDFIKYIKDHTDIPVSFVGFNRVKKTSCDVHKESLYIKYDGSTYPCCMAGGEVGNPLEQQVYLGNIDINTIEEMRNKTLNNLDNETCNKCTPKYSKENKNER